MPRKWMTLAAAMVSVTGLTVGISAADDEDSPLRKIMERVNAKNLAITKGVRTAPAFKKSQKDLVASAEELARLAREAKDHREAVKKAKDVPDADTKWNELMDSFANASENLAKVAGTPGATQVQAKEAHTTLKKTCTECHNIFRVEDEGF